MSSDAAPIPDLPSPYEFKKIRVNKMLNALYNNDQKEISKWWVTSNKQLDLMKPVDVFEINQDKVVNVVHAEIKRRN